MKSVNYKNRLIKLLYNRNFEVHYLSEERISFKKDKIEFIINEEIFFVIINDTRSCFLYKTFNSKMEKSLFYYLTLDTAQKIYFKKQLTYNSLLSANEIITISDFFDDPYFKMGEIGGNTYKAFMRRKICFDKYKIPERK